MEALRLVLFSLRLLPTSVAAREAEIAHRLRLAEAIASVTSDQTERFVLMKISRFESNYRSDVADCTIRGPQGERGAFQILARFPAEKAAACGDLEGQAAIALSRIRESIRACAHLPREEQLAVYARGRCDSVEGKRLSKARWPRRGEVVR